jgi:hypothetical protein
MLSIENFLHDGYKKLSFENPKIIDLFLKKITNKVNFRLKKINKDIKNLENFYQLKLTEKESGYIFNANFRNIKIDKKEIKEIFKSNYVKAILEHYYGNKKPYILYLVKNRYKSNLSGFRIVQPNSSKVANIHSESTYGMHCFTIWIPIIGFSKKSTLKMFPKSHMVRHEDKNIIKSNKLNKAQLLKKDYLNKFKNSKRLNFKKGEFLIFHPDLLHGGSLNKLNKTRVSMEIRIFSDKNVSAKPKKRTINPTDFK